MHARSSTLCAAVDGKVPRHHLLSNGNTELSNFTGSLEIPRSVADMITMVRRFRNDETGATAIDCGFIAAGISLAIIAIVNALGTKLNTKFTSINSSLR
jgi:pilus assembly protein Flp/PilA